jgi:hypothetical protein
MKRDTNAYTFTKSYELSKDSFRFESERSDKYHIEYNNFSRIINPEFRILSAISAARLYIKR